MSTVGRIPQNGKFTRSILTSLSGEIEICLNPNTYFSRPVMDRLCALRSKNPLDVFGIDFDVMPDGRLLYFEANASMLLLRTEHPNNPPGPQEPYDTFMAGFDWHLENLKLR